MGKSCLVVGEACCYRGERSALLCERRDKTRRQRLLLGPVHASLLSDLSRAAVAGRLVVSGNGEQHERTLLVNLVLALLRASEERSDLPSVINLGLWVSQREGVSLAPDTRGGAPAVMGCKPSF